jgi:hypothetical protein
MLRLIFRKITPPPPPGGKNKMMAFGVKNAKREKRNRGKCERKGK